METHLKYDNEKKKMVHYERKGTSHGINPLFVSISI